MDKKIKRVTTLQEQKLMALVLGSRKPKTGTETKLLKQIKEISRKGYIVEIPS